MVIIIIILNECFLMEAKGVCDTRRGIVEMQPAMCFVCLISVTLIHALRMEYEVDRKILRNRVYSLRTYKSGRGLPRENVGYHVQLSVKYCSIKLLY